MATAPEGDADPGARIAQTAAQNRRARRLFFCLGCLTFVALVPIAVAVAFLIAAGRCVNHVLAEVPSPDGRIKAVVFERDCGATTDFSTQISILRTGVRLPNDGGNAFIADTDHGAAPAGPGGGPEVQVRWEGPRAVRITHDPEARVFRAERSVGSVAVRYSRTSQ